MTEFALKRADFMMLLAYASDLATGHSRMRNGPLSVCERDAAHLHAYCGERALAAFGREGEPISALVDLFDDLSARGAARVRSRFRLARPRGSAFGRQDPQHRGFRRVQAAGGDGIIGMGEPIEAAGREYEKSGQTWRPTDWGLKNGRAPAGHLLRAMSLRRMGAQTFRSPGISNETHAPTAVLPQCRNQSEDPRTP
jgi:hypothetical protein